MSFHAGLRDQGLRTHAALVGVWDELGELAAAIGDFDHPSWLHTVGFPIQVESADLYELSGRSFPGVGRISGETLSIFTAQIEPNAEAAFHERLRARQEALAGEDALLALHVGRRLAGVGTEVIIVAVWRDPESRMRLTSADFDAVPGDSAEDWVLDARLETYEAVESESGSSPAPALT